MSDELEEISINENTKVLLETNKQYNSLKHDDS